MDAWIFCIFTVFYENTTVCGVIFQTSTAFMEKVEQRIGGTNPLSVTGYVEAPLAYDAVWALALALNNTQTRCAGLPSSILLVN